MTLNHFNKKWVPFRKRLQKKGLSLSQLRNIEDEVLLLMTDEDYDLGQEILADICEKRNFLTHRNSVGDSLNNGFNSFKINELCDFFKEDRGFGSLEFSSQEPLAHEFDERAIESTFSSRMHKVAQMIRKEQSVLPYKNNLSQVQKLQISQIAGSVVSPEVLAHAVDQYVGKLRAQIKVAEAIYFGRIKEGMERLLKLSDAVRQRVDEIIWEKTQEEKVSPDIVIAAILHSVEEQMGMHEVA